MEAILEKKLRNALIERNKEKVLETLQTIIENKLGVVAGSGADGALYVFIFEGDEHNILFEIEPDYTFLTFKEKNFCRETRKRSF